MAHRRYANAILVKPQVSERSWNQVRTAAAKLAGRPSASIVQQASDILGGRFDPDRYLLTHCSLVASVDVEEVPNVRLGSVREEGRTINRKYADFRITAETDQYINNNMDSFERQVLLKSYKTLIGAQNFVEHVQVEDLSKGRVIDAVARDIGDSVYVDILVATDRKHKALIRDIQSGKMGTLSMGCFLPGAQVSMADGRRLAIEDVAPGDLVLTHQGRSREVQNKQIRKGVWDIRHIQAVGVPDTIAATANHPFFVFRAPETCACGCGEPLSESQGKRPATSTRRMQRRFNRGHDKRLWNPNNTYSLEEHRVRKEMLAEASAFRMEEVEAGDLKVGDFLCFPRMVADAVDASHGRARLLGYFLAEGSFLKHNGELVETQFNFSMGEQNTFVAEVVNLLKQEFGDCTPWVQERPERDTCVVHVYGRQIAEWFRTMGGEYSNHKQLAPEVMAWPVSAQIEMLGAWINGDGSCGSGRTSAVTTSYDLACQMHAIAIRCGLWARLECKVHTKSAEIRSVMNGGEIVRDVVSGKLPAFTVVVGTSFAHLLEGATTKVARSTRQQGQNCRVLDDVVMFPITSITESTYEGWVHDMEVEEDHSYIVDGCAVHNCTTATTTCTKCGNVAVDETDMCECVRYHKGNWFLDEKGGRHRIAELCGHASMDDPPGGVQFIEASWVASPAFTGAVLRNVITPSQVSDRTAKQIQQVLSQPPPQWVGGRQHRASEDAPFDFGDVPETGDPSDGGDKEQKPGLKQLEDDVYQDVVDSVERRVRDEMQGKRKPPEDSSAGTNDNLQASTRLAYNKAAGSLLRTASSDIDAIDRIARLDREFGLSVPVGVYRAALRVGSINKFGGSADAYLRACRDVLGTALNGHEVAILRLGRILSTAETLGLRPTPETSSRRQ